MQYLQLYKRIRSGQSIKGVHYRRGEGLQAERHPKNMVCVCVGGGGICMMVGFITHKIINMCSFLTIMPTLFMWKKHFRTFT